jgi:hypothetical protein
LIKNFSVSTKNDFAMLNAPITLKRSVTTKDGDQVAEQINLSSTTFSNLERYNNKVDLVKELKEDLKSIQYAGGFVSSASLQLPEGQDKTGFVTSLINSINDSVFTGELELFLDPFYLFDDELMPYTYMIRVEVNRPTRFNRNNEIRTPDKSYLTGNYLVTKIAHTITYDTATTKLDIIKFPDLDDDYNEKDSGTVLSGAKIHESIEVSVDALTKEAELLSKDNEYKTTLEQYNKYDKAADSCREEINAEEQSATPDPKILNDLRRKLKQINEEKESLLFKLEQKKERLNNIQSNIESLKQSLM